MTSIRFISIDDALISHALLIDAFGGSHGLRDRGLLESALAQPQAMFGGQFLHADLAAMASAYLFHLCCNYPFVDGNKRVAWSMAELFLDMNGIDVDLSEVEVVDLTIKVAEGTVGKEQIAEIFRSRSNPRTASSPTTGPRDS